MTDEVIKTVEWTVKRTATITRKPRPQGGERIKVEVRDEDRLPFLNRWFSGPVAADDFVTELKEGRR